MKKIKLIYLSPELRQYVIVQIADLCIICLGMSNVWASPMTIKLRDEDQTPLSRPITDNEAAWLVAIHQLAGLVCICFSGILLSKVGPKTTILISFIPRFTMCFLVIFATEPWILLLARSFGGMSDLMALSGVSTYTPEVSNNRIRGALGTMTQINSAFGMLIMFGVGPFVSYFAMNILMTCIVFVALIPLFFIPESPYFLYLKGRKDEALEILTFLHGTEEYAHNETKQYSASDIKEVDKWALFKDKIVIKGIAIVIIMALAMQLTGYNAVNYYLQTIFKSAQTSLSSEISSLIIGVIQLVATLCTFVVTNRFGRKPIICTSLVGMGVGMIGLASFFTILENGREITGFLNFLPLLSVAVVIYGYNAGLGSLFSMLVAEILYAPVRSYGISIAIFTVAGSTFAISLAFPAMMNSMGAAGTYWLFGSCCVMLCLFTAIVVPETRGKSFAEIQRNMGRKDAGDSDLKTIDGEEAP